MVACFTLKYDNTGMKKDGLMQTITTLLAYSLPLMQFFFAAIPEKASSAFIFRDNFLIVSIFTAVTAYILILSVKSNPYYTWSPFQKNRIQKHKEWNVYTNPARFTSKEIANYQKINKPPKAVYSVDSNNIVPRLLVPILTVAFLIFFSIALLSQLGVTGQNPFLLGIANILQMLAYVVFIVSTVLALASQFLRESGLINYRKENGEKYDRSINLVRQRNGFKEYKTVSLVTQAVKNDPIGNAYHVFYVQVDDLYYIYVTDIDVDMIYNIQAFSDKDAADRFYYSSDEANE